MLDDVTLIVNNRHVLFLRNVERLGYEADVEDEGEEDEAQESPEPFSYPDLMDLDDGWMDDGGQDVDLTVERLSDPSVSLSIQNLHDLHNRLFLASSHSPLVHTPTPSPFVDLTVERLTEPSASLLALHDLHNRQLLASSHSPLVHTPTPSPSVQPIPTSPSPFQSTPLNSLPAQLVFTETPSHESSVPSDSSEN